MKTLTLEKLVLTNYRNIEHQEFEFNGNSKIVGENRIGKTNTLEAIHYLLTDKLLNNDSDITRIKPLSDTKKMVTVEGFFDIDGQKLALKKVYGENWVKVRNTQETVLKGHETTYYVNGIKQDTLRDYNKQIEEKFGFKNDIKKIDLNQLLINPFYVGDMGDGLDWTVLREFIIKLVGDITDEDVFSAKPETLPIKEDLKLASGKIDQIKKLYKATAEGLKLNIQSYESQIQMLEQTECPTEESVAIANKAIDEINTNISILKGKNGTDLLSSSLREKIANKKTEIANARLEDAKKGNTGAVQAAQEELNNLIDQHHNLVIDSSKEILEISQLTNKKDNVMAEINECENIKADCVKEYNRLKALKTDPNISLECPTCHRKYEEDEIERILTEYISNINTQMKNVADKGVANKEKREKKEEELDSLIKTISAKEMAHESTQLKVDELAKTIQEKKIEIVNLTSNQTETINPVIEKLNDELKELEESLIKSTNDYNEAIKATSEAIAAEQEKLPTWNKVIDDKNYYDRQMKLLDKVKGDLEQTRKDLIAVEQKVDLVNLFTKTKLAMLDKNISKVFGNIKFQLLSENISGGFDTICKPYIYDPIADQSSDVIWKSGSKSEMVATGIAIVERIKEKLDLPNLPYLFDEGGEISTDTFNTRFKTKSQIICVRVEDNIQKPLIVAI